MVQLEFAVHTLTPPAQHRVANIAFTCATEWLESSTNGPCPVQSVKLCPAACAVAIAYAHDMLCAESNMLALARPFVQKAGTAGPMPELEFELGLEVAVPHSVKPSPVTELSVNQVITD